MLKKRENCAMKVAALKIIAEDRLLYSPIARYFLSYLYFLRARSMKSQQPQQIARKIVILCQAVRLAATAAQMRQSEASISRLTRRLSGSAIDWNEFDPAFNRCHIEKAALIKPYLGKKERGVVYISFENQWLRLLSMPNLADFAREYTLVLAPVWCPPHSLVSYLFPLYFPEPIVLLISDQKDLDYFPRISARYQMAPLLSSHWVNPDWFKPYLSEKKDLDIVMVANFGKYKRHHVLFRALRDMPTNLRVVLMGQCQGNRTGASLLAEAKTFGVSGRFELLENQSDEKVFQTLARSKISLILSRREGSCVAVVESIFANTPVGMLIDAEVGSRQFINDQTGRLFEHGNLAAQLLEFIANADRYQPRKWALDNRISCRDSSGVLNNILKEHALASGQEWTQDIAQMQWRPNPQLLHEADRERLRVVRDDIINRFGMEIGDLL